MTADEAGLDEVGDTSTPVPSRLSALLRELAVAPQGREAPRPPLPQAGAVVGRFELVREVGRGGFGVVFEARDRELGRPVAVKVVLRGRQSDACEERLLREAEVAAGLSHPNIVTLYDAGRCEHGPFLVFEFLEGQTLAQRMDQGRVPLREAIRIAVEVTRGLASAHEKGVVHRDLKPSNVFLCERGQVKLLDLGLALVFGRRRQDGGTPGFMAPEQVRRAPEDERTDVWALGVILYQLLTGKRPFAAGRFPVGEPPLVEVPGAPALGELVARMLEADPVKRPRDASEILPALVAYQQELERTPSSEQVVRTKWLGRRQRRRLVLGAAVSVTIAAATGWALHRRSAPEAPLPPSIAVLPFADLSPNRDREFFSDGLADEILGALARVDGLRVPGRTSSFSFKGKSVKLADIGRELGVAAVLEGSVRTAGNRVRITAQVVNVKDGYRQWSETYDRELTDIFAVQDEIASAVVRALGVRLVAKGMPPTRARTTDSPEAYAEYLLGRREQRRLTPDGFQRAAQAHERALQLDPGFAPAWAGLSFALYWLATWEQSAAAAGAVRDRALSAAEKAVALAPDLPEALSVRASLRSIYLRDWTGADRDLRRALALSSNDPDTRRLYAILHLDVGNLHEALAEAKKSVELDPLGQAWVTLGTIYQESGDLEQASIAYRRYLVINPDNLAALVGLGRNLLLQGKATEALAAYERTGDDLYQLWGRAAAQHSLGNARASQDALDALVTRHGEAEAFPVAEIHAWRREWDAALDWLEMALARREGSVTGEIAFHPFFAPVRGHPRFQDILKALNLPTPSKAPAQP